METIGIALAAFVGVGLTLRLLVANVFWRSCDRDFFPEAVERFLREKEDGGRLVFRQRGSRFRIWLIRGPGLHEDAAMLTLTIPLAPWSQGAVDQLNERFRFRGFDTHFHAQPGRDILGELRFEVPDIWNDSAGEPAAWAVRCVADALDLPADARFIIDMEGRDSLRVLQALREE